MESSIRRSKGRINLREPRVKLARVGPLGRELPAVVDDVGTRWDLSPVTADIDAGFLAGGGLARARDSLAAGTLNELPAGGRGGAPIAPPSTVVCIGLNYTDHAAETGMAAPAEPIMFLKAPNTVIGPDDTVLIPRRSVKTDYEVELAVVIGQTARYLDSPAAATDVIAGYTITNDMSEREFQLERGGQWDKGKSCETFNPLGPWLVTPDEVEDPQALGLRLWVNGELRQNGYTGNMIFDVAHIVWYLSQFLVLKPGDVVNTGTPAGVAVGANDYGFLRAGDVVELEIDGLGRQRQTVGQA